MPPKKRGRPKKPVSEKQSGHTENTQPAGNTADLDTGSADSQKDADTALKQTIKESQTTETNEGTIPETPPGSNSTKNPNKRSQSVASKEEYSASKKPRVPKGEKRSIEISDTQSPNVAETSKIMKLPEKPKLKQDGDIQPSNTIYLSNLNDKIKKEKLQKALFLLFVGYGDIIKIQINWKNKKMRGQAFILFSHENEAKLALRSLQNYVFFGKPLLINFSKHQLVSD